MNFDLHLHRLNKKYELYRLRKQLKKCHKKVIYFISSVKLDDKTSDNKDALVISLRKLKTTLSDYIDSLTMFVENNETVILPKEQTANNNSSTIEAKVNYLEVLLTSISIDLLNSLQHYTFKNCHEITKVCNSISVDIYLLYKADMKNPYSTRNNFLFKSLDDNLNKFNRMLKIKTP